EHLLSQADQHLSVRRRDVLGRSLAVRDASLPISAAVVPVREPGAGPVPHWPALGRCWSCYLHFGSRTMTSRSCAACAASSPPSGPMYLTRPGQCEPSPIAAMRLGGIPIETRTALTAFARSRESGLFTASPPSLEVLPISVTCSVPWPSVVASCCKVA